MFRVVLFIMIWHDAPFLRMDRICFLLQLKNMARNDFNLAPRESFVLRWKFSRHSANQIVLVVELIVDQHSVSDKTKLPSFRFFLRERWSMVSSQFRGRLKVGINTAIYPAKIDSRHSNFIFRHVWPAFWNLLKSQVTWWRFSLLILYVDPQTVKIRNLPFEIHGSRQFVICVEL